MLFVRAYPRETQEMVFDAHDRAFALDVSISGCQSHSLMLSTVALLASSVSEVRDRKSVV